MPKIYQSFTYKMAAKINWHRYGTKLRHCRPVYRGRRSNYHPETGTAVLVAYTAAASSSCGKAIFVRTLEHSNSRFESIRFLKKIGISIH